ncbi:MAG: CPBP family glutamic-type intramembrane protease [Roseateles sp.]|uniref:CPBP family glutamic-type intramembrane protease n=1 Tax=Roseateles sp. TaxID=1971397 RepID=UPI0039EAD96D
MEVTRSIPPPGKIGRCKIALRSIACAAACATASFAISTLVEELLDKRPEGNVVYWYTIVAALGISPFIETFIFQSIPFKWATQRGLSKPIRLALMSTPFALAHYSKGMTAMLEIQFGGLLLAMVYIHWHKAGTTLAFRTTALAHFLHNGFTAAYLFHNGAVLALH